MRNINRSVVAGALAIPFVLGVPGVAMAANADQDVRTESQTTVAAERDVERQDDSLITLDLNSFQNERSFGNEENGLLGLGILEIEDNQGDQGNQVLGLF